MKNKSAHKEINKHLCDFKEIILNGTEAPWCVDGRPDFSHQKGPQMLGGSLHPIVLLAIFKNESLNAKFIKKSIHTLKKSQVNIGVHRGAHKNIQQGLCDCGFADKLKIILATAVEERNEISNRLTSFYKKQAPILKYSLEHFIELLSQTYVAIENYSPEKIKLTGENLIKVFEQENAQVVELEGNHKEELAFLNIKKNTTFDSASANKDGYQAFNLDFNTVIEQSSILGLSEEFTYVATLILYLATEIVLVEKAGKTRLEMEIHY